MSGGSFTLRAVASLPSRPEDMPQFPDQVGFSTVKHPAGQCSQGSHQLHMALGRVKHTPEGHFGEVFMRRLSSSLHDAQKAHWF